jgi:hypothetical protein
MELKYLFDDIIIFNDIEGSSKQSEKCVEICENFAVKFLNYYLHNKQNRGYLFSQISAEEALEFFKQEKHI